MLYKIIHIGEIIKEIVDLQEISIDRILNFFNKDENFVKNIYESKSIDTEILLKWSKLLKYDFFSIYTSHLILYAPPSGADKSMIKSKNISQFRKNIYTQEIKNFIIGKSGLSKHRQKLL